MSAPLTITRPTYTDNDTLTAAQFNAVAISSATVPSATGAAEGVIQLAGDLGGTATAPTIAAGAVTLAKMANLATDSLIGRTTAGTGVPEALTAAQVLNLLALTEGSVNLRSTTYGLSVLDPAADSMIGIGQSAAHHLKVFWTYNATAANAVALIQASNNPIIVSATQVSLTGGGGTPGLVVHQGGANRVGLGTSAENDEGTAKVQLSGLGYIKNTTAPAGTPSGGGYFYAESGALKWKGSSGTVTTLAPA